MRTTDYIQLQKRTAMVLLTDLTNWTQKAGVLAGGAVRDWELGYGAQDLDIYLNSRLDVSNGRFAVMLQWHLEDMGYDIIKTVVQVGSDHSYYEQQNQKIIGVFEFSILVDDYTVQTVQVIRIDGNPEEVMQRFPVSTSQAMMLRDGSVLYTQKFFKSLQKKVVSFNVNETPMSYLSKMMRKRSLMGFSFMPEATHVEADYSYDNPPF